MIQYLTEDKRSLQPQVVEVRERRNVGLCAGRRVQSEVLLQLACEFVRQNRAHSAYECLQASPRFVVKRHRASAFINNDIKLSERQFNPHCVKSVNGYVEFSRCGNAPRK